MELHKVCLAEKFGLFQDEWAPKIVGELNDYHVKVVRLGGEFVWHRHDSEDELFLVVEGEVAMHYRDGDRDRIERFGPGEFLIVPHGVDHKPVALPGTKLVLVEPKTTKNTGTAGGDRTAAAAWI
ncbi:MAG TPA: cupin domain-containing protein [Candidatus Tumulicola sp.]